MCIRDREDGKIRKIIRLKLVGHRAAELEFSPKRLLDCGRVISVEDLSLIHI